MIDKAPPGKIWFCMACGRKSITLSSEVAGWDESCVMNCIAIDEGQSGPTEEQRERFAKSHAAAIENGLASIARLSEQIRTRKFPPIDPELLALAALATREARS